MMKKISREFKELKPYLRVDTSMVISRVVWALIFAIASIAIFVIMVYIKKDYWFTLIAIVLLAFSWILFDRVDTIIKEWGHSESFWRGLEEGWLRNRVGYRLLQEENGETYILNPRDEVDPNISLGISFPLKSLTQTGDDPKYHTGGKNATFEGKKGYSLSCEPLRIEDFTLTTCTGPGNFKIVVTIVDIGHDPSNRITDTADQWLKILSSSFDYAFPCDSNDNHGLNVLLYRFMKRFEESQETNNGLSEIANRNEKLASNLMNICQLYDETLNSLLMAMQSTSRFGKSKEGKRLREDLEKTRKDISGKFEEVVDKWRNREPI